MERADNYIFENLKNGTAVEAFDAQAFSALETGTAKYWYPQYLATVVIAVDRDRTNARINSWSDLLNTREEVGYPDTPRLNNEMLMSAVSYGLEGEGYTLKSAAKLFAALRAENRFVKGTMESPVLICYDYYAAKLIKSGRNIEVIIPSQGTFTYEKGLLSNIELVFSDNAENTLLSAGFRLLDGRGDHALYPNDADYENARRVTNYPHFNNVSYDVLRTLRREVLHIRLYTRGGVPRTTVFRPGIYYSRGCVGSFAYPSFHVESDAVRGFARRNPPAGVDYRAACQMAVHICIGW